MPYTFFPADSRAVGTGNPALDIDNAEDILTGMGAAYNVLNTAYAGGADPTGGADSAPAINAALQACPAGVSVTFPPGGKFRLKSPLVIGASATQKGVGIAGWHGATASGDDAASDYGTTFIVDAAFTNPTYSAFATAAVLCLDATPGSGGGVNGIRLRDFWVDGSAAPAGVDGVAAFGPVNAGQCERVGVYKATGRGFGFYNDGTNTIDGWHLYSCLAQNCTGDGFGTSFADFTFVDCHAQSCGGEGFNNTSGANCRFLGCRSDLNADGWVFDVPGGVFYGAAILAGCGTQGNSNYGLKAINSSATGTAARARVTATGCSFDQDVTSSVYASGRVMVELNGTELVSGNAFAFNSVTGSPVNSITTAVQGSSNGAPTVVMTGGKLNPITAVLSGAASANLLKVSNAVSAVGLTPASTAFAPYSGIGTAAASVVTKPTAPASTVSATLVMMGLGTNATGTPAAITPTGTGLVQVTVTANVTTAAAAAAVTYGGRFGTGAAPVNGAAVTGTRFGAAGDPATTPNAAAVRVPISFTDIVTLTPGTAYWFDLALATANAADAASVNNVSITLVELTQ